MAQDDSRIEQLKKKLYSNSPDQVRGSHRGRLHPDHTMVNSSWDTPAEEQYPKVEVERHRQYTGALGPLFKKILLGSIVFLVVAAAISTYIFYKGSNIVSADNIDLKMLGPVASPAGEILSLDIDIINRNNSDLQLVDLVMTYPEGTRSASDGVTQMITDRLSIGAVKSGEAVKKTVKAILFGEENSRKNIRVSLEYRVPGSSSVFVKTKDFPIFIGSSPVTLTVDTLKQITANQMAQFKVTVTSNSTSLIKGLLLKADYPPGFQFGNATPDPLSGNDTWSLGDLEPGGTRVITITGSIIGQNNDSRSFNFSAGTEDPKNTTSINTVFVTSSALVTVQKPFLGADISLNGDGSPTVVVDAGDAVKGEITWQNNLDVPVNDVILEAHFGGDMLDKTTINGDSGFYQSANNTLMWDKTTLTDLESVAPGATGHIQFSFASLPPTIRNNNTFRRPALTLSLSIKAKRLSENNVPEDITSTVSRQIQIQSGLSMKAHLVRNIGPFQNTGPLPPVANKESTYTALVSVANSFNTVKGVTFVANLPSYVKWLGVTNPTNNGVSYNADKREISWSLGDIAPGTGYNSSAKEFAFQVSFLPSISQVDTTPLIVLSPRISGKDAFTGTTVEDVEPPMDIQISADPTFVYGQDKVVAQ